jgi:hypothetical protein
MNRQRVIGYKMVAMRGAEWAREFVTSSYEEALWFGKYIVASDQGLRFRIFEITYSDSDNAPERLIWPVHGLN